MKVEEIRHVRQPMPVILIVPICMLLLVYLKTGTIGVVAVSITAILTVLLLFAKKQQDKSDVCITIDDTGITDHRQKYGTILWKDIRSAYIYRFNNAPWLCLKLHNAREYTSKLNLLNRFSTMLTKGMGMSAINFSTAGLDVEVEKIYQMVMVRCENYHLENIPIKK
jgi:hypothetical protein